MKIGGVWCGGGEPIVGTAGMPEELDLPSYADARNNAAARANHSLGQAQIQGGGSVGFDPPHIGPMLSSTNHEKTSATGTTINQVSGLSVILPEAVPLPAVDLDGRPKSHTVVQIVLKKIPPARASRTNGVVSWLPAARRFMQPLEPTSVCRLDLLPPQKQKERLHFCCPPALASLLPAALAPQSIVATRTHTHDATTAIRVIIKSRGGRLGGRHPEPLPTASPTASPAFPTRSTETTAIDASSRLPPPPTAANPSLPSPTQQPAYPGATTPTPTPTPSPIPPTLPLPPLPVAVAPNRPPRRNSLLRRGLGSPPNSFLQSPFRTRGAAASFNNGAFQSPLRHLSAARLWNPTNSTPRIPKTPTAPSSDNARRSRRPSTPPPPPVPLPQAALDVASHSVNPIGTAAGDYPLLTLPELHLKRLSIPNRASLQLERSAGSEQRVSLPPSVRHPYDEKGANATPSPAEEPIAGPSYTKPAPQALPRRREQAVGNQQETVGLSFEPAVSNTVQTSTKVDKGKGKEVMALSESRGDNDGTGFSQDLERGQDLTNQRLSTVSGVSGIGSAISSSNSSIMGDPDQQADGGEDWGPLHPCYPHLNPHVPVDSPEYVNTRIIRIRRDWLLEGDLAPTFSNLYPEILDPAGVSEQEFRRVIEKLNSGLVPIFSPYNWRNILDGMLGLATGWLWDDFGLTGVKARLRKVETWIEQWNVEMEKTAGKDEGAVPPKIIPLRRTGYMTLDIQIPDPEISPAPPSTPGASRAGLPAEQSAAITA
ncbi:Golgin subfamily A member 7/ERF4 family-domain-containing protein [Podospora didyma]|uniref:Ras modification protein ERF4 n=1 Tax=Podospora didyma TaxID=330526 RepID=A0AAE0KE22_9PEZI|nr:Golgin subfamily A member 7/ERF4 family-domain-containing protein [Podospora didyma]